MICPKCRSRPHRRDDPRPQPRPARARGVTVGQAAEPHVQLGLRDRQALGITRDDEGVDTAIVAGRTRGSGSPDHRVRTKDFVAREHEVGSLGLGDGARLARRRSPGSARPWRATRRGSSHRRRGADTSASARPSRSRRSRSRTARARAAAIASVASPWAELLEQDRVGDGRALLAAPAVLLRNLGAGQSELPDRLQEVIGNRRRSRRIHGRSAEAQLCGELAHRIAHELLLFCHSKRNQFFILLNRTPDTFGPERAPAGLVLRFCCCGLFLTTVLRDLVEVVVHGLAAAILSQ